MTGLDTNVLVRYITQDDPKQAGLVNEMIERSTAGGERMLIHPLVLCELIWVLESGYNFSKSEILPILERILRTAQFEITDKDLVWAALADYRRKKGDFSDYYLGWANEKNGAVITLTFDTDLKKEPRFRLISN